MNTKKTTNKMRAVTTNLPPRPALLTDEELGTPVLAMEVGLLANVENTKQRLFLQLNDQKFYLEKPMMDSLFDSLHAFIVENKLEEAERERAASPNAPTPTPFAN